MSSKDDEYKRIEPTDGIPTRKYREKDLTYDKILDEFMESGLELAKVKMIPGRHTRTVYSSLRKRQGDGNYPLVLSVRGDDIYLKRKKE